MFHLCAMDTVPARESFSQPVSSSHSSGRSRALPPLNALRAFEACARLGSTVAAAAELGVTHGAISKQVALLERWLGMPLFERGGGRLTATSEAARFATAVASALDLVERSTEVLRATGPEMPRLVRLTTTGSVASLWLVPRLAAFRARNPGVEVWVSESRELVPLGRPGGPELALRLGRGPWAGVRAEALMTDEAVVVCAPSVATRLRTPDDLARVTLLHDEDPRLSWQEWLEASGLERPAWGHRGPRLADGGLVLQAARSGQGVALTRRRLAAALLRSGALVQPFPTRVRLGPSYWLVLPRRGTPLSPGARALAAWLRETTRQEESAAAS
jgi:DNA-binding transcriptional LysR family regulator